MSRIPTTTTTSTKKAPLLLLSLSLSLPRPTTATSSNPPPQEQCGRGLHASPFPPPTQQVCIDPFNPPSNPALWAPWTHPPFCIEAADSPWCVFTNAASPRNQGISIITTPEIASDTLDLRNHLLDHPFHTPRKTFNGTRPYDVVELPGRGKGGVANRRIAKDRVIMVDHAVVLATVEYPADVMREEVHELMRVGTERLADRGRDNVLGLARKGGRVPDPISTSGDAGTGGEEVEDVLLANSFMMQIQEAQYMGLFPNLAVSLWDF